MGILDNLNLYLNAELKTTVAKIKQLRRDTDKILVEIEI